jgi:hypothetical protein
LNWYNAKKKNLIWHQYNKVITRSEFETMKTKIYGENESEQITLTLLKLIESVLLPTFRKCGIESSLLIVLFIQL